MTIHRKPRVDLAADMRRRCGLDDPKPEAPKPRAFEEVDELSPDLTDEERRLLAESDRRLGELYHARAPAAGAAPAPASRGGLRVDLVDDMRRRFGSDQAREATATTSLRVDLVDEMRRAYGERPAEG